MPIILEDIVYKYEYACLSLPAGTQIILPSAPCSPTIAAPDGQTSASTSCTARAQPALSPLRQHLLTLLFGQPCQARTEFVNRGPDELKEDFTFPKRDDGRSIHHHHSFHRKLVNGGKTVEKSFY